LSISDPHKITGSISGDERQFLKKEEKLLKRKLWRIERGETNS